MNPLPSLNISSSKTLQNLLILYYTEFIKSARVGVIIIIYSKNDVPFFVKIEYFLHINMLLLLRLFHFI